MARSKRSVVTKRNRKLRRQKMAPAFLKADLERSVKLTAYVALQEAKKMEEEGVEVPADIAEQADHAVALQTVDEQKRRLTAAGHFYFTHPHSKTTQPEIDEEKVSNMPLYAPETPAEDKKVRVSKGYLKNVLGKKRKGVALATKLTTKDF